MATLPYRSARSLAVILGALLALLLLAPAARAGALVDEAAKALQDDPVYIDPGADQRFSSAVDARVASAVRDASTPIYLAVLPAEAADEVGGDPSDLPKAIYDIVGQRGTYAVLAGNRFRAGSTVIGGQAGELAQQAVSSSGGDVQTALLDFVDGVEAAAQGDASGDTSGGTDESSDLGTAGDGGGGFPWGLAVLGAAGGGAFYAYRRRSRKRQEADLAQVRAAVDEDITSFGEQIDQLDLDVRASDVAPGTLDDWRHALDMYERAKQHVAAARSPEDMRPVTEALEEGRYALARVRAAVEGQPLPERRPPCFFDPRHGPSTQDALWAPAGGAPREVPVCAADAARLADGYEPDMRMVPVGAGGRRPYWEAGPAYGPWAGGYFGGYGSMLLPGLLVGTMLGSSFGWGAGIGGYAAGDASGGDWGDGGFGGGGDFGGGGGDFGGGDFGGGGGDF